MPLCEWDCGTARITCSMALPSGSLVETLHMNWLSMQATLRLQYLRSYAVVAGYLAILVARPPAHTPRSRCCFLLLLLLVFANSGASNIAFNQSLQIPKRDTGSGIEKLEFRILHKVRAAEQGVEVHSTAVRTSLFGLVSTTSVIIDKWKSSDTAAALHFPLARLPANFGTIFQRKSFDGYTTSTITTTQLCAQGWFTADTVEGTRDPHVSYIVRINPQLVVGNDGLGAFGATIKRGANVNKENPFRLLECLAVGEKLKPKILQYDRSPNQVAVEMTNCAGPSGDKCVTESREKNSEDGLNILNRWSMPSEIRRWNEAIEKGATANLNVKSNIVKVDMQTIPNALWVRSVWDEDRAINLSGAAVQTHQRTAGAVFCGIAPLPIIQISNVISDRTTVIDIVLAYASAFALIFVQLRVGVGKSLSTSRRVRNRANRDVRLKSLHQLLRSEFCASDFARLNKGLEVIAQDVGRTRLVAQSIFMTLIGFAELIPVWLVYHIEDRAQYWTGIAARVCSSSMGWQSSSLKNLPAGLVPVDGYATSTIIKTTTFIHSEHIAKELLIGAIIVSVVAGVVTLAEIFYAWSDHLRIDYDSESDDLNDFG